MNDALALTRSKPKHPPAKVAVERERVRSKVEKSNTKRRSKNVGKQKTVRELHDELKAGIEDLERQRQADRKEFLAEKDSRIAGEIDERAQRLMRSDPSLDYGTATRMVIAEGDHFAAREDEASSRRLGKTHGTDEQMREAVERRMELDKENYRG